MWDKIGYVHLHRKLVNNAIWPQKRSFADVEASLDLMMGASIKDEIVRIDGIEHQNYRGSILTSERELAERWRWHRSKVRRFLSRLKKEYMIKIEYYEAIRLSRITIIDFDEMDATDPDSDPVDATTSATDKTLKTKKKAMVGETLTDPVNEHKKDIVIQVLDYLNKKTRRTGDMKYKSDTPKYQKHILARFADGYRIEDFTHVIDVKTAEWLGNGKMEPYLRPSTLFGHKFKEYRMQQTPKIPRYRQMAAKQKLSKPELLK